MVYASLRDFLNHLEAQGEYLRIKEPVSTVFEMTEIGRRLIAQKGPAVCIEKPVKASGEISRIPALINLFGTVERVAQGIMYKGKPAGNLKDLREIGKLLAFLRQPDPPANIKEAFQNLPLLKTLMAMKPAKVQKAPCQEIVLKGEQIDLGILPIQTCWPQEPAPLITWPLIVTLGSEKATDKAEAERYNLGIYRMQKLGPDRTLMRWLKHRGGARHFARWKAKERKEKTNRPFPVAAVIGADPGMILAAVTPVPETLSEYQFAGLLRGKKVPLVDCKTVPLRVPAEAEIVIEGHISLEEEAEEGPYGDHTGYYNSVETFPVFQVSAITMRKKPVYLTTYTGRPPDEPSILGEALNEIFIPIFQQQFPEVLDFWLPPEACSYRIAVVKIRKAYPGHAKRVMMGVWSYLRQFMYTKWVIIVDEDINARDWKEVMWAISTRMDPVRDLTLMENTPIDYLDFASPETGLGSKAGLDATTKKFPETHREWGRPIEMEAEIIDKVSRKWKSFGF